MSERIQAGAGGGQRQMGATGGQSDGAGWGAER